MFSSRVGGGGRNKPRRKTLRKRVALMLPPSLGPDATHPDLFAIVPRGLAEASVTFKPPHKPKTRVILPAAPDSEPPPSDGFTSRFEGVDFYRAISKLSLRKVLAIAEWEVDPETLGAPETCVSAETPTNKVPK